MSKSEQFVGLTLRGLINLEDTSTAARHEAECPKCAQNPKSIDENKRGLLYLPANLRKHEAQYHKPEEELIRWLRQTPGSQCKCPCCDRSLVLDSFTRAANPRYTKPNDAKQHFISQHPALLASAMPDEHVRTLLELAAQSKDAKTQGAISSAEPHIHTLLASTQINNRLESGEYLGDAEKEAMSYSMWSEKEELFNSAFKFG